MDTLLNLARQNLPESARARVNGAAHVLDQGALSLAGGRAARLEQEGDANDSVATAAINGACA
eukprot:6090422-Pyramimonas_sp.AAC.1